MSLAIGVARQSGARMRPPRWRAAIARSGGILMTDLLTRDLSQVRVHSTENAELAPDQRRYPVVILRAARAGLPHLPASARDKLAEALTIENLTFLVAAIAVDLTLAGTPAGAVFNVLIGVRSDHSHEGTQTLSGATWRRGLARPTTDASEINASNA